MGAPHEPTHHTRTARSERRVFYEFPYTGQGGPKTGRTRRQLGCSPGAALELCARTSRTAGWTGAENKEPSGR